MQPEIKAEELQSSDPTFEGGSSHTAVARLSNPTTKEFTYLVELYLGITKAASSGVLSVTIPAGAFADVNFPVIMPVAEDTYAVYLDVTVGVGLIAHYKATEDVTIQVSPVIDVGPITWG